MFRPTSRGNSTTPTLRKESLFDRLRRRVSQGRREKRTVVVTAGLNGSQHLSRSTGTLVRAEDFEDHHSVNTSSLESDNERPLPHIVQHYSNQNLTEEVRHVQTIVTSPPINNQAEQERKRLVALLSTQGIALLQSLDTAMKRVEQDNDNLKRENRRLTQTLEESRNGTPHKITSQHVMNKSTTYVEERIEQSAALATQISELASQKNDLNKELATVLSENKKSQEEILLLKRQLNELKRSKRIETDEEYHLLQNKFSDLQREKETNERQLNRDLQQARDECTRLTAELSKSNALLNECRNEHHQLNAKYEALVLQQADLTRSSKIQSAAYQELQKRVAEMAEDQITNDSILQATIQMAKKADKERKRIYGVVENTGKIYETYFAEYESDAHSLRAKLKNARSEFQRARNVYETAMKDERSKNVNRLRAKDEELAYLRALLGNRDSDMSKAYGRYSTATELLGMTLLMQQHSGTKLSEGSI